MRRTGRVIFIFVLILGCMFGLWMFQSWREEKIRKSEKQINNVYITGVSGSTVQVLGREGEVFYDTATAISGEAVSGVADLYLQKDKIVKILKKPDEITEKLLKLTDTSIFLQEYGEIQLDDNFVVYRVAGDGTVTSSGVSELLIGGSAQTFVVAGGKVCAAVIHESVPEKIRVLLRNNDNSSYGMEEVTVTSEQDFYVLKGEEKTYHSKGEKVTFKPDNLSDRVEVASSNGGKICVLNLKRKCGNPAYRGVLEIAREGDLLQIINEVPLEEYLYSVVPSEMPTEYSEEALKAQAICARSYAVRQMKGHRLAAQGAHVDDSVSYQVYNDLKEDEKSIRAVDATKGLVVSYQGKTAATYFYSTSYGCSAGTKEVWYTEKDMKYLPSMLLTMTRQEKDLSGEEEFRKFLKDAPDTTDSKEAWYRWKTTITSDKLEKSIQKALASRYAVNPTQIQTKKEDGTYGSREISDIGELQNIEVKERGKSGIVSMIEIQGSKETIHVYTEYNIRSFLIGENAKFKRQDKKEVSGLSILPSGFFYIQKEGNKYTVYGGGYGHGVGMSQTGANVLAKKGKTAENIISFYFPETSVQALGAL